jgi:hypothetical protein
VTYLNSKWDSDKTDKAKKSPRISKKNLYKEVTELKKMLKKLMDRI